MRTIASLYTDKWRLDNISGVIFDKDGTIIDSHLYWGEIIRRRVNRIISYYSLNESIFEELCAAMGLDNKENRLLPQGPVALVCREEIIRIMLHALKEKNVAAKDCEISEIFNEVHREFIKDISDYTSLLSGVKNVLEALKAASVKMALVTSDSIENTCRILEDLSIEEYFDAVIGKEASKEPKISGIPAVEAVRALKQELKETVCIGDAPVDALMSVNGGLRAAICVATGQTGYPELEKYTPYLLNSLQELKIELK